MIGFTPTTARRDARRHGHLDLHQGIGNGVEVTTLLIPTLNDNMDEIREMARFICTELGAGTPWHVSRFYPQVQGTGAAANGRRSDTKSERDRTR